MNDEQNQSLVETVSSIENEVLSIPAVLSPKTEQQMEVIKSIFLEGDDRSYGEKIAEAAAKLLPFHRKNIDGMSGEKLAQSQK
jgi:hypothetical protein